MLQGKVIRFLLQLEDPGRITFYQIVYITMVVKDRKLSVPAKRIKVLDG